MAARGILIHVYADDAGEHFALDGLGGAVVLVGGALIAEAQVKKTVRAESHSAAFSARDYGIELIDQDLLGAPVGGPTSLRGR